MRARPFVAVAATAALLVLGTGVTAQSASACVGFGNLLPCGGTFTIDAPEGVGFGADWSPVTFTVADEAVDLDVSLALNVSGDIDLQTGDVLVQVKDGSSWDDVTLASDAGDLKATVAGPGALAPNATGTVDLRIAVTDATFNPIDDSGLDSLTVTGSLLSNEPTASPTPTATVTPPAVRAKPALVGGTYATASAQIAVSGIDLTTSPTIGHAVIGKPLVVNAKLTNDTGSDYHDVIAIPLADSGGDNQLTAIRRSLRGSAGSPAAMLKRLKAAAASTETVVEFKKNGVWINLNDTEDVNDADLADLPSGASHTTPWRFTFNDPNLVGNDNSLAWLVARFAPPGGTTQPTLVSPDAGVAIVGFSVTELTIARAAATSTPTSSPGDWHTDPNEKPTSSGDANPNGNGGTTNGALAHTGSPLREWAGIGLLLVAAGFVMAFASRRRGTHI